MCFTVRTTVGDKLIGTNTKIYVSCGCHADVYFIEVRFVGLHVGLLQ